MRSIALAELGWGGIALVLLWLLLSTLFAYGDLDPAGTQLLKRWVIAKYEIYHLERNDLPLPEKAALLQQAQQLEFVAVTPHGHARNLVVKVELAPNPAHPPHMPTVLYFRMKYSSMIGWSPVPQSASVETWYLARFFL